MAVEAIAEAGVTIFDRSRPGRIGVIISDVDNLGIALPPDDLLRGRLMLPEADEETVLRHYVGLSQKNFSIETGMYPLGSCTMKYNPRRHEAVAALRGFRDIHPLQPDETIQGALRVMHESQLFLGEILGMKGVSVTPMGGAQGELAGMLMIRRYHQDRGDLARIKVLVPDSAHGTNPASAAMANFEVVPVESGKDGNVDLEDFRSKLDGTVAAAMFTQPSTLGLFDTNIEEVARLLHENGSLLYGDGANMNALLGKAKLGELGFDVVHINEHKALTGPHGGGGPGAGPVGVGEKLLPYLPSPVIIDQNGIYRRSRPDRSIGRMGTWYGNFAIVLRAWAYMRTMGEQGLKEVSDNAVLNANVLKALLKEDYEIQYGRDRTVMHEVVIKGARGDRNGITAIEICKRLMDYGYHPPTVHFPLIAEDCLMIEPVETESIEAVEAFARAMREIAKEARENPDIILTAPHTTFVGRLDEVTAARRPVLTWKPSQAA